MHPWFPLSCTACHGGDGAATTRETAHVRPVLGWPSDERVRDLGAEPDYARFRNPTDLRVADQTCGACHAELLQHLRKGLHGTTAGHLNDGLYEGGVNPTRAAIYAVFGVSDDEVGSPHGLRSLRSVADLPVPRAGTRKDFAAQAADLPRKACMQCHLYSEGVGLAGRLGQDGLYRGEGCAACHVPYAEDGLSASADAAANRREPGHPLRHELVLSPPTSTCTSCHVGDAAVGNGFRGLSQLYPSMPAGPDVPGTTDRLLAGQFFLSDGQRLPPDLHHVADMHCVDCHSVSDVMGDGDIHGAMEHAVGVECSTCHGTLERRSDLRDGRGALLPSLERRGDLVVLRSRVSGRVLRVKQAVDVVDPEHPDFSEAAAAAMTEVHGRLECYACHSGWNANFYGFHFDRNEAFSQLDLLTGQRTPGAVRTNERVFATLRAFTLGLNAEDQIAPYVVAFSSMGTLRGAEGEVLADQVLPQTAAGLSGMGLVPHQTHTTQRAARSCVECHRSPATLGLGTGQATGGSFALARGLLVLTGERGVETLLLDREDPSRSMPLARLPVGGARTVTLDSDAVTGHASTAFVVVESAGVLLVDLSNPAFPEALAFAAAGDARDVLLFGDVLAVANGRHGLRLLDVADRRAPRLLADLPSVEARGLSLQWPWLYVADGAGGLLVAEVSEPRRPAVLARLALVPAADAGADAVARPDDATGVASLFQPARPDGPDARTTARLLVAVANGAGGLILVDASEPRAPAVIQRIAGEYGTGPRPRAVQLAGRFELGDRTGQLPTRELDLAWVTALDGQVQRLFLFDVTDPLAPQRLDQARVVRPAGTALALARSFLAPELVTRLLLPHAGGLSVVDVTDSRQPRPGAEFPVLAPLSGAAVEAFAFDRLVDEGGRQLKDISHAGARFLSRDEQLAILGVSGADLGPGPAGERRDPPALPETGGQDGGSPVAPFLPLPDSESARRRALGFAIGAEEPLARLLRGAHPPAHDSNGDRALSRGELEDLFFALLDVNRDGVLDGLEWPRHPDAAATRLDRDGDGRVDRGEMDLLPPVLALLDLDGDERVAFGEWPFEVVEDGPPTLTYASAGALRRLLRREGYANRRARDYELLTGDRLTKPHDVPDARLEALVAQGRAGFLVDLGGDPSPGGFLQRWDLDRDGAVTPDEHVGFARLAPRCDTNADGRIDARDRPERRR